MRSYHDCLREHFPVLNEDEPPRGEVATRNAELLAARGRGRMSRRPAAPHGHALVAWRLDREAGQGLRLISPTLVYVLVMLAAPLLMVITFSFWTQDYLDIDTTPTLANYREAWGTPLYQVLMWRSLKISVIVTVVTVLLAFPDRLLPVVPCHPAQGAVAVPDHRAVLDQLPAARVPVEGDPRL